MLAAQTTTPYTTNVIEPLSFSRIGISAWASGGVRTVEVGSPAAIFNNPALLKTQTLSAYTEFGKRSETDYIADTKFGGQFLLPNFGQVTTSFNNINVALGYSNLYDKFFSFGPYPVTTVDQPNGTGEFFTGKTSVVVHTITASVSHFFDDNLSVGLTSGVNIVSARDELWKSSAEGSGTGMILISGFYFQPIESFHIGGSLQLSSDISYTITMSGRDLLRIVDPDTVATRNNSIINARTVNGFPFIAKFPLTAQAGFKWDINEIVSVMAEVDYAEWSSISSNYDNVINNHFGIAVEPIQFLKIRGGYFSQLDPAKPTTAISINQTFWTAGVEWIAFPGITIIGGTTQSLSSETKTRYISAPKEPFRQDLYLLGLLYNL